MRVRVTKRMLREGLVRCLKRTDIDKLSVSELCREAGVNRATFYNHYEIPKDILSEMGQEFADDARHIFESNPKAPIKANLSKCLELLYNNRSQIRIIYLSRSDQNLTNAESDIFMTQWKQVSDLIKPLKLRDETEYELVATAMGLGVYNLILKWIVEDIDKTPDEIAEILATLAGKFLS